MALLTTVGNGAIQGSGTTLSNADVDKSASGDTLIIFDNSATGAEERHMSRVLRFPTEIADNRSKSW